MELQYYGANCFRISTKKAAIVIDDNLKELGQKTVTKPGDIVLFTGGISEEVEGAKIVLRQPGEYEVSDISVKGIAVRGYKDDAGQTGATVFQIIADDDIRLALFGHIYPELTDDQLEALGTVDVLCLPVGGGDYTLDPEEALKLIKKVEPKIVIPSHYQDKELKFSAPQQTLDEAIKVLSMEVAETLPKLKLKSTDFGEATKLIVLERQ